MLKFDLLLSKEFPADADVDVPSPAFRSTIQTPTPDVASTTNQPQNLFQVHSILHSTFFSFSLTLSIQQLAQQQQQAGVSGPVPQPNPALRDDTQTQQLREQIAQNPALLQLLIQQLSRQNPAIAQMLADNPEALLQHLGIDQGVDSDNIPIPPGAQVLSVDRKSVV